MTERVLVSIQSSQQAVAADEVIETVQPGKYRYMAEQHVIMYEEILEESQGQNPLTSKCIMKISRDQVTVIKKGHAETVMHFAAGKPCDTYYDTPFGIIQMSIVTHRLQLDVQKDAITVLLDYGLEMDCNHISDCHVAIEITSLTRS